MGTRKEKLTPAEKDILREQAHSRRDEYEDEHLGGFEKIYPTSSNQEGYRKISEASQKFFEDSQGIRRRAETQK
jgi:tubulin polyglutamylase TTLL6/13